MSMKAVRDYYHTDRLRLNGSTDREMYADVTYNRRNPVLTRSAPSFPFGRIGNAAVLSGDTLVLRGRPGAQGQVPKER
jgi:hypothetical protein